MILLHLSCRLGGVAEGRMTEMESDSIMLEAPALSAQRVVRLIVPSVGAHAATEPGECSSPAPPPRGVLPTMSSDLGLRGRGFWRCSRAADSRCWSASAICATGDRVVPKAADPTWDRDPIRIPIRIVSSKRPPPPSRPDKTSLRRACGPDLKGAGDHRAAATVASEAPASPVHTCRWGAW